MAAVDLWHTGKPGAEAREVSFTSTSGRSSADTILADQEGQSRHVCSAADATSAQQHAPRKHQRSHSSAQTCPPHGAKAICGARPRMEDAYTAVPFLLEVPRQPQLEEIVPPRINAHVRSISGVLPDQLSRDHNRSRLTSLPAYLSGNDARASLMNDAADPEMDALHFFGVFDGHGGSEAALHCARTLHERLSEALSGAARAPSQQQRPTSLPADLRLASFESHNGSSHASLMATRDASTASSAGDAAAGGGDQHLPPASDAGNDAGNDAAHSDSSEGSRHGGDRSEACYSTSSDMEGVDQSGGSGTGGAPFTAAVFEGAFTDAFVRVDEELAKATNAAQVGTTAVVALVGDRQLYIGNCGDSRAVLCRSGVAMPLTDDHKAAREDETARVQSLGGEIMYWNGDRVMGVLAVSRAIGDHNLRPFVIAQPEVTIIGRSEEDELLLLASDGLWDVLTNQEAVNLAQRCLKRARQRGASRQAAARVAASVLTRAAVDQGSSDNVTVVVVDLSRSTEPVQITASLSRPSPSSISRSQELQAQHTAG